MKESEKTIRPSVVLIKEGKILVLKSTYSSGTFYLLPGGSLEKNETLVDAAIREVKEETNYDIKIEELLYLQEWIDSKRNKNVLYVIFLGSIIGGKETYLLDTDTDHHIKLIEWVDINKLEEIDFKPVKLIGVLQKDFKNNFRNKTIYLGKC
jgi:ADP-ribose pyrophosphatase YjhB (NUDIX family)